MKTQLTQDGHQKLVEELELLTKTKRPAAVERLARARAMGDLSENSEYHAAKEELAFVEGRVREVDAILKQAEIVEVTGSQHVIGLGSKVTIQSGDEIEMYEIVGEFEANPMEKKLSATSPIGKALIGKKVNDEVQISVPAGTKSYTVISVQ